MYRFSLYVYCSSVMEVEYLKKLVEHSEPKPSYHVISTGRSSQLNTIFSPPLTFPEGACSYEMALIKLETYYSFPNIKLGNNSIAVSFDNGKEWKVIKIPIGCYEVKAINQVIQRLVVENGGKADQINISPNVNTLKCVLDIKDKNYQVNFNIDNSLRTVLGFNAEIYKIGHHEGEQIVNIMNVNSILVNCDIISASRVNGKEAPVIHNVSQTWHLVKKL